MKRSNSTVVLVVACIVASMTSCVFAPKDIYKAEDKKSTISPEVTCTVDLSVSQDTVYVESKSDYSYNSNIVVFKFKCNTGDVIQVKSIIDGDYKNASLYLNEKYPSSDIHYSSENLYGYSYFNSTSNSISVYVSGLSLGTHTLELQFLTVSGSGSIAGSLGAEGFVTKKWTIIATSTNYYVKDTVVNGFKKIYWNAYKSTDFKEYIVKADNDRFEKHLRTNYLIDSSYVGQDRDYSVYIVKRDESRISVGSLRINKNLLSIKPAYIKGVGMVLKLENNKYYNAIDSIYVLLTGGGDTINIRNKYKQDSIFKINGIVNRNYSGTIKVTPKDRSSYNTSTSLYDFQDYFYSVLMGQAFINSSYVSLKFYEAISNDEFIYSYNDELYRYSVTEQKSYSPAVRVCNKSNYLLSSSKKTLFYLDECDLKFKALSTANGIVSIKTYPTSSSSSTNGMLAISDVDTKLTYQPQNYRIVVTDVNTGQEIASSDSISIYNSNITGKISSNGKYMLYFADNKTNLGLISNNSYTKIWGSSASSYPFTDFNSENDDEFVYKDGSTFTIKSTKNGEDIVNYWLGDDVFSVDFKNNQMLCYNSPYLRVRNLRDGSLIKEIKIDYCYRGDVILSNNVLIFKSGIIYFVK